MSETTVSGNVTLANIISADWSLELDFSSPSTAPGSGIGNVVEGFDDIDQCIRIICTTVPSEDPLRPTFGVDLTQYVDRPIPVVLPVMVGLVTQAIEHWEPRVTVQSVSAQAVASDPGQLLVTIVWRIDLGTPPGTTATVIGANRVQTTVVLIGTPV